MKQATEQNAIFEQAVRRYHQQREQHTSTTISQRPQDPQQRQAFDQVDKQWAMLDALADVEFDELRSYDQRTLQLQQEKQWIIGVIRLLAITALIDALLSIVILPLGLLEPFIIGALFYFCSRYLRIKNRLANF